MSWQTRNNRYQIDGYPPRLPEDIDIASLARELVDKEFPTSEPFITKSTKIFSLGSCFAGNISNILKESGYDSFHMRMAETENSTFATRLMLETRDEETIQILTDGHPVTLEEIHQRMAVTDCLILTIGVALVILDENEKYSPGLSKTFWKTDSKVSMIMSTVEGNIANVLEIISIFRRLNPDIKVVLTVSPIPLMAGLPGRSAFTTDCISKSILRTAAHVVMDKKLSNVSYWPSFEIVRWLGAHTGPTICDNGVQSRHVNAEILDLALSLFVEKFAV